MENGYIVKGVEKTTPKNVLIFVQSIIENNVIYINFSLLKEIRKSLMLRIFSNSPSVYVGPAAVFRLDATV